MTISKKDSRVTIHVTKVQQCRLVAGFCGFNSWALCEVHHYPMKMEDGVKPDFCDNYYYLIDKEEK